jgi:hypothetical protein
VCNVAVSNAADTRINGNNARAVYAEAGPSGGGNASISMTAGPSSIWARSDYNFAGNPPE